MKLVLIFISLLNAAPAMASAADTKRAIEENALAKSTCLAALAKSAYFSVHKIDAEYLMKNSFGPSKKFLFTLQPDGSIKAVEKRIGVFGMKDSLVSVALINAPIAAGQAQTLLIAKALAVIAKGSTLSTVETKDLRNQLAACESVNAAGPVDPDASNSLSSEVKEHLGQKAKRLKEALGGTETFSDKASARSKMAK